ncbi:hypothetical protein MWU49_08750 [Alcanivorax sp. S6407]|uniref:hypothetical protein n=1 Tax=Alcanivorax sp. S6407 TaxID=2926424 RepID=UPI001FF0E64F|nr:hypothetical protein [Alcanivorax sp. S6407]MCK0153789.1 hypothetical protein [Alcanivorax sp. S6407]
MKQSLVLLTPMLLALTACGGGGGSTPPSLATAAPQETPPITEVPFTAVPMPRDCTRKSWVAGTTEWCDGALIYRDYVYDDYGADAGLVGLDPLAVLNLLGRAGTHYSPLAITPGLLSPTAGDQPYPPGLENTADLVSLMLSLEGDELQVRFELNTLYSEDNSIAALAIDTDNDASTGGGDWPGLGVYSDGWEQLHVFRDGDPDSNIISGTLALPDSPEWRIQAVVAQADGTVMNVAFRGPHESARAGAVPAQILPDAGNFWEDNQARVLASGDISEFGEQVSLADLRQRADRPAPEVTGFQQRVYTSNYTLPPGEGVSITGIPGRNGDTQYPCEQYFHYLGKYQPYGVYVPDQPGPHELQMVMHGCEANHASQINQRNFQQAFADDNNRILAAPLGRGTQGFYSDISERDVLDVQADVIANYPIDTDRVMLSGYSMGGYGTLRLAALYPQDYAAAINWVGFSGSLLNVPVVDSLLGSLFDLTGATLTAPLLSGFQELQTQTRLGAQGDVVDYVGNLKYIPTTNAYSGADEIVHVTTALALQEAFIRSDSDYVFYLHPIAEHLTYIQLDEWQKMADYSRGRVRVQQPATVRYRYEPALDYPEYELFHNKAYWVSDIENRSVAASQIDLHSDGCGETLFDRAFDTGLGEYPVPWVSTQRTLTESGTIDAGNTLSGSLENVFRLTVDVQDSCLAGSLHYDIHSDGAATITLSDGRQIALVSGNNSGTLP